MNINNNVNRIILLLLSVLFYSSITAEYYNFQTTLNIGLQKNNKDFTRNKSYHDFSYNSLSNSAYIDKCFFNKNNFNQYTVQNFQQYFAAHEYTENQILNQRCLYMFDDFVKFAQTYSSYQCTIQQLYAELKNLNIIQKAYCTFKGAYCSGLQKRINFLYDQLSTLKNNGAIYKQPIIKEHSVATFSVRQAEYNALKDVCSAYTPSLSNAIDKRIDAYKDMMRCDYALQYEHRRYYLNDNSKELLSRYGHDTTRFTECYGNQLHQAIHQESLNILDCIDSLPSSSILYDHQEALIDFTLAMVDYNHEGLIDKAMNIGDLCWTLLDYGQAVAEGAALGVYVAANDILNNPIQATINIVAGKQVLVYQLSKVLYNVAEIGVTALIDSNQAKDKWDKYTEPLNNIIDAIYKKEVTIRDTIKGGTAFVVGYKAQGRLLGGLGKFCNTIKQNAVRCAVRFAQKNVSSFAVQEYLATPEGYLLRSVAKTSCTASCPNQYDHLKQWLRIKEYTSVIDTTQHGIERLIEREFSPKDVYETMKKFSFTKIQKDGAIAYVKQIKNNFNVIIFNKDTKKVVTAIKNTDQQSLAKLGRKYGWK